MLGGRQLFWMILKFREQSERETGIANKIALEKCKLRNNDLQRFQIDWNRCLINFPLNKIPDDETLLPMYYKQVKSCTDFEQHLNLFNMMNISVLKEQDREKDYTLLYEMVQGYLDNQHIRENEQSNDRTDGAGWSMPAFSEANKPSIKYQK